MTRKVTTITEAKSDMSGQVATQFRQVSFNGLTIDLDMTDKEASKLDGILSGYVSKSHNVQVAPDTLREWANSNGYPVGARGRLSSGIREAFFAAMGATSDEDTATDSE